MKALAIISRDLEKGSTKYRLVQYLDFLAAKGVTVDVVRRGEVDGSILEKARRADLVFNQKCLLRLSIAKKLIAASRRIVFDFDDAIYTRPGKPFSRFTQAKVNRRFHLWLRNSDVVTTPNEFLAGYARRFSNSVEIIPMALDLEIWRPRDDLFRNTVIIGWTGAPVNLPLLEQLAPILGAVLRKFPAARLAIFSGRKPNLGCPFEYHPFRSGAEAEFVRQLDIGLLPLADDEFTRGKSPIKALQYLACSVPVVGNVIGATGEILNPGNSIAVSGAEEWSAALETLIANRDLALRMGQKGREQILETHDLASTARRFYDVITSAPARNHGNG